MKAEFASLRIKRSTPNEHPSIQHHKKNFHDGKKIDTTISSKNVSSCQKGPSNAQQMGQNARRRKLSPCGTWAMAQIGLEA
jgi:hypothetical protein